jgi:sulfonate transport system ATP-binding protein
MTDATSSRDSGLCLELCGLSKRFGAREVLRNNDLTIAPGEFIAILGRSGCGRSPGWTAQAPEDCASMGRMATDCGKTLASCSRTRACCRGAMSMTT